MSRCRTRSRFRARSSATRPTTQAEQAFIDSPEGQSLAAARGHKFAPPAAPGEIGAATGIEFRGKRFIAAAEPVRRGGGAAGVVKPR